MDAYERKEDDLTKKQAAITATQNEVNLIKRSQMEVLEKISGLTQEEAKKYLLDSVESEVRHETAMKIKEVESQLKEEAEQTAREIIATAIQRCAADHAAETTVSVVPPAQRRDEGSDHRPGGPEHPDSGNHHRRRPDHR